MNQRFQREEKVAELQLYHTAVRGYGLKTNTDIVQSSLVTEYCGEVISEATCIERMSTIYADLGCYYFLEYDSGEVVDGCRRGSTARFVNHSCQPNCHIEKWQVGGEFRIGLFASVCVMLVVNYSGLLRLARS
jgi:SET domain-containing protein